VAAHTKAVTVKIAQRLLIKPEEKRCIKDASFEGLRLVARKCINGAIAGKAVRANI
jgi:hypothetical protein